jgi:hypothetical protein
MASFGWLSLNPSPPRFELSAYSVQGKRRIH